jgi:hypothetical protein
MILNHSHDRLQFSPFASVSFLSPFLSPPHNKIFSYPEYKNRITPGPSIILQNRVIEKHVGAESPELNTRERR